MTWMVWCRCSRIGPLWCFAVPPAEVRRLLFTAWRMRVRLTHFEAILRSRLAFHAAICSIYCLFSSYRFVVPLCRTASSYRVVLYSFVVPLCRTASSYRFVVPLRRTVLSYRFVVPLRHTTLSCRFVKSLELWLRTRRGEELRTIKWSAARESFDSECVSLPILELCTPVCVRHSEARGPNNERSEPWTQCTPPKNPPTHPTHIPTHAPHPYTHLPTRGMWFSFFHSKWFGEDIACASCQHRLAWLDRRDCRHGTWHLPRKRDQGLALTDMRLPRPARVVSFLAKTRATWTAFGLESLAVLPFPETAEGKTMKNTMGLGDKIANACYTAMRCKFVFQCFHRTQDISKQEVSGNDFEGGGSTWTLQTTLEELFYVV